MPCGVYAIGSYIMVFRAFLFLAPLPCPNAAAARVADGCGWVAWAEAAESATG